MTAEGTRGADPEPQRQPAESAFWGGGVPEPPEDADDEPAWDDPEWDSWPGEATSVPDVAASGVAGGQEVDPEVEDAAEQRGDAAGDADGSGDEFADDIDDTAEEVPDETADAFSPPGSAFSFERVRAVGPTAFGSGSQAVHQTINHQTIVYRGERRTVGKTTTTPVASGRLADMVGAYAETGVEARLDECLARRRVAVLSGPPGSGRYTTACLALRRLSRATISDLWLSGDGRIDDVRTDAESLAGGGGYLWEAPSGLTLDPLALSGLEAVAEQRNAMIVLIGQFGTGAAHGPQFVEHREPLRRAVFLAQLRYRLTVAGRCLGDCVNQPPGCRGACLDVRAASYADDKEIREALQRRSCGEAAYLADHVARRQPTGAEIARLLDELRLSVREDRRKQASSILDLGSGPAAPDSGDGHLEREQRAFRISYLLLGRQPMALRQEAAGWLREALGDPQAHTTLTTSVDELLGDEFQDWRGERDDAVGRLRHPDLARDLVDVAWNDRTDLHRPLLRWLDRLAASPERTLRIQAAVITGRLATYDFERVRGELLARWADHRTARLRQVAALALEQAFRTEGVRGRVRDELWRWAAGRSSRRRDTAARALLTRIGGFYGSSALQGLRLVAADPMQRRRRLVARAAQRCFQPRYAVAFLRELVEWCHDDNWLVRLQAGRVVLRLARQVALPRGVPEPELLSLARDDAEIRATLVWLWQVVLTQPFTAFEAWDAFGAWLAAVRDDRFLTAELAAFAADVWAWPSLRTRARFHLQRRWQQQIPNQSLAAQLAHHVKEH